MPKQSRPSMVLQAFRIPEVLWSRFVERCEREGLTRSEGIREAIRDWVGR